MTTLFYEYIISDRFFVLKPETSFIDLLLHVFSVWYERYGPFYNVSFILCHGDKNCAVIFFFFLPKITSPEENGIIQKLKGMKGF